MISAVIRFFKRLAILIPGLLMAYIGAYKIYPLVDKRVPTAVAIFITYVITAYLLIPAFMRFLRLFIPYKHQPEYCVTPDGFASDPVNIGLVGSSQQVKNAMNAIGWKLADKRTPKNMWRMFSSLALKKPYPNAPFSSLYLFGRKQDFGFQQPLDDNPRHRHHVRFWANKTIVPLAFKSDKKFWDLIYRHSKTKKSNEELWLGAASKDVGIAVVRHTGQLTHQIHDDTDAERELIVSKLKNAGLIKEIRQERISKPYRLRNRAIGGTLASDGILTICKLN